MDRARRGDHILLARLDCGFRHLADAFERLTRWLEGGVHVHVIRQGLDTAAPAGGPFGGPFLRTLTVLAEFKRAADAARAREAQRGRRREGSMLNQHPGYGYRLVGRRGRRRKVADQQERQVMAFIAELHDERGLSFEDIYLHFWKHGSRTRAGNEWSVSRIKRAYAAEISLRASGESPPAA